MKKLYYILISVFILFLMVAFVQLEINPFLWSKDTRHGFCIGSIMVSMIGFGIASIDERRKE